MSGHRSSLFTQRGKPPGVAAGGVRSDRDIEAELQRENDQFVDNISVDMSRLKSAAQTLRDEAAEHNKLLDTLQDAFSNAKDGVKGSITKLDQVMAHYGFRDTLSCAGVLFVLILVAYFLVKRWSQQSPASSESLSPAST